MGDIKNLLNQVSIITKKNDEFLDATGGRFNIFRIAGVNHYENTHSAVLAELLNPKGSHGLKSKFLQAFLDRIRLKDELKDIDCENANVKTEAPTEDGRIDILIRDNMSHSVIIENKIYARDQVQQLKKYNAHGLKISNEKYQIFYLTLYGTEASDNSGGGINYSRISYADDIISWLEQCVQLSARYPLVRETINQYINHLKKLTNQDMDKINQNELVELLSKPDNIKAAFKISENVKNLKIKLVTDMAEGVAKKFAMEFKVNDDANGFYFYKKGWKEGAGIWFAESKGMIYYAIKTSEACFGKAILQMKIVELFEQEPIPWDPFGYGIVMNDHWQNNTELYLKMVDGSLAEETIIVRLKKVMDYLKEHSEIEEVL
ncbi:MAG: hypothetical protein FD181_2183 [Prolixibacteraceae bacterium]|nr:MAG: hypothetical protein FD181_2183 [Prolixibacteraceae bacterium]